MKDYLILCGLVVAMIGCATVLAQRDVAPTRSLPGADSLGAILASDGVDGLGRGQPPLICYNAAGDVVMIFDPHTGQFRFDFSAGLVQSGKCRN